MKTWPDTDGSAGARYLNQLRLRSPISPIYYPQRLRSFQDVVVRRQFALSRVSRDVLEAWLRERAVPTTVIADQLGPDRLDGGVHRS